MTFSNGPLAGVQKGLRQVVRERFGEEAVVGKKQEDLIAILESEEDFRLMKQNDRKYEKTFQAEYSTLIKFHYITFRELFKKDNCLYTPHPP